MNFVLCVLDAQTNRSLVYIATMLLRAIGLRQAFDRRILDFTCFNDMGLINPEAVAVSLVTIHFAVGGRTTKGVPSSTHDKVLR
jgi:hypothetical protein